jgi:tricorn protease
MLKTLALLLVVALFACAVFAQAPLPFTAVGVSQTHLAFSYAGEIWLVERSGGVAKKLLNQPGRKSRPTFSPDGTQLAFTLELGGETQTYVMPVAGGQARQLTWHPKDTVPLGWSADGKQILARSGRLSDSFARLYLVPLGGGTETELPLPTGYDGSLAPDGKRIAYLPSRVATTMWRNYRGGMSGDTLPWMFRAAGVGTIVGKRTWGDGIGGYLNLPSFVDGGGMSAPNRGFFNPKKGTWDIENNGVAPDLEVEMNPAAVRAGRDPQLEKAVQIAMEELKKTPAVTVKKPKYPIYK